MLRLYRVRHLSNKIEKCGRGYSEALRKHLWKTTLEPADVDSATICACRTELQPCVRDAPVIGLAVQPLTGAHGMLYRYERCRCCC